MSSELTDLSEFSEFSQLGACSREYENGVNPPVAVRLNANGCLSLDQIVQSFGDNPISEEQAWGILHQTCTCLKKLFEKCDKATKLYLVLEFRHLLIHRDGDIHEASFTSKNGIDRVVAISEQKILEKMAILVFSALERGLQDEYQRQLSPELEKLLDLMLEDVDSEQNVGGTNEVDEGIVMQDIEDEVLPYQPILIDVVLKRCQSHLASGSEASQHFRNVCRALVTQALELSSFLQKTRETQMCTEELQNLGFSDWANLWQEMMSNLRNGVKLKKTDYTKNPIEFALTPYEMLMEDIRSRRYKLNKVMIDGTLLPNRIKKDAHSLLLDFIRSRPPLKPVSERRLPPRETHSTPLELLMASIRSGEGRSNLRKTSGPPEPKSIAFDFYMSHIFQSGEIQEMDRLGTRTVVAAQLDATPRVVQRHRISEVVHRRRGSLANSVVTRSKSFYVRRPLSASIILPATSGTKRMIIPDSNFSNFDPDDDSDDDKDSDQELQTKTPPPYRPPFQKDSSKDIKEVAKHNDTSKPASPSPKTSVTSPPSEFVHIRSTLNRAKFEESQSLDENLRGDILKAKVCFGCKKTRFYFFNRSHKCPWCNYTFCSNCVSKVHVREDFIDAAPLHALTPNNRDVQGSNLHHSRTYLDVMRRERLLEPRKGFRESLNEEAQYSSSKTHLRRSNTIGRMDLYGRSDGQEPHRGPLRDQIQLVDILKDLNGSVADAKTVQVVLCTDCAEVAEQHIPEEKLLVDRLSRLKNSQS